MVFEVFCSHCQKSADCRLTPLVAHCAECRLTPLLAHCVECGLTPIIYKNLSSYENLSDPKGPLSTVKAAVKA